MSVDAVAWFECAWLAPVGVGAIPVHASAEFCRVLQVPVYGSAGLARFRPVLARGVGDGRLGLNPAHAPAGFCGLRLSVAHAPAEFGCLQPGPADSGARAGRCQPNSDEVDRGRPSPVGASAEFGLPRLSSAESGIRTRCVGSRFLSPDRATAPIPQVRQIPQTDAKVSEKEDRRKNRTPGRHLLSPVSSFFAT